jgi:hypothetical protein
MSKFYWHYFVIPLLIYFIFTDELPTWIFSTPSKDLGLGGGGVGTLIGKEIFSPQSPGGSVEASKDISRTQHGPKSSPYSEKEAVAIVEDGLIHGQAAYHCSSYLAPTETTEWHTACDAQCVTESLNFFKWNFGVQRVVDLSHGSGGDFSRTPGSLLKPVLEKDLLFPEETSGEVPLAILALRALKYQKDAPSLYIFTPVSHRSSKTSSAGESKALKENWIKEAALLPPEVKASLSNATLQGRDTSHLVALLNSPAIVLTTLLTARLSQSYPSLLTAGSENGYTRSNVVLFNPASPIAADFTPKSSELERLKRLVCGLSLEWSVELITGHVRVFPPLRVYAMPPRTIPPALWGEITDFGAVPVRPMYHNDALEPGGTPKVVHYSNGTISILRWKASRREEMYYGITDTYLFNILDRNQALIKGKRVAILGSLEPWYECVALTWGAGEIFTVEYGGRTSDHPAFQFITPSLMEERVKEGTFEPFDAAFSISSFEHDGLGRYGDPLSGNNDITTMAFIRDKVVKPGGHLFFTVPMGRDCIKWNEERVYGKVRLPKLIAGWEVVDTEGVVQSKFEGGSEVCHDEHWQPIYLLKAPTK